MFDFAISRNQRRRPTGRIYASWLLSFLGHLIALLLLIQYPELLRGGMYHRFRSIPLIANILEGNAKEDSWRTVAVLRDPMSAPSAATLKKFLFDWDKKGSGVPPIHVRWGDAKTALADMPPMPRVRNDVEKPKLSLPANELAGSPAASGSLESSSSSTVVQADASAGNKGAINLPPPGPAPKTEITGNSAPSKIPDSVKEPSNTARASTNTVKVFDNEQKAIRSQDSGFFDTKGYPLGAYADLIVERIKGKWFIPSNLRDSQGHTTVVFYIDKDGRFMNARIVMTSGSNSLDLAALNAVIESNPFPPLPKDFPGDHVGAKFVFSYNEPQ